MFEREIQYYIIRGAEIADGRSSVSLADILATPLLPQRLRAYFRAEAAQLLDEEHAYRVLSRFDHSTQEVRKLERMLDDLLRQTAKFRRDEYLDILEHAVKINFNYLCRPQLTLRSFIFRGQETVSAATALQRLAYFDDYPYLTYVLKRWIEKQQKEKHSENIIADEFQRNARKIDDQALSSFTAADLRILLQPMFHWIAGAQTTAAVDIPTDAFIMFFDDKNIRRLSDRLANMQISEPAMNIDRVCRVIESMLNDDGATPEPPSPPAGTNSNGNVSETISLDDEEAQDDDDDTQADGGISNIPSFGINDSPIQPAQQTVLSDSPAADIPASENKDFLNTSVDTSYQFSAITGTITRTVTGEAEDTDRDIEGGTIEIVAEDSDTNEYHVFIEEAPSEPSVENRKESITSLAGNLTVAIDEDADTDLDSDEGDNVDDQVAEEDSGQEQPDTRDENLLNLPQQPDIQTFFARETENNESSVPLARFSDRNSEFKVIGGSSAVAALADTRSFITDDERKKFIRKIFRRNDPEYEKALDAINDIRTWKEASSYIDALYLRYGVDPYAKHAIKFTDIIYGRFIKTSGTP